jgi:hypothetical protein
MEYIGRGSKLFVVLVGVLLPLPLSPGSGVDRKHTTTKKVCMVLWMLIYKYSIIFYTASLE